MFGTRAQATMAVAFGALLILAAAPAVAQDTNIGTATVDGGETVFNPVLAFEWNTDGDLEGWSPASINNATVAGGVLSGESLGDGSFPAGADPIFNGPPGNPFTIGAGAGEVDRIQFAVQFDAGAPTSRTEMFLFRESGGFGAQAWVPADFPTITDGGIHTYNLDFDPTSVMWGETISAFRLDPTADNQSVVDSFAYDYFRAGSSLDTSMDVLGDVDGNMVVDQDDFEIIRMNFFATGVGREMGDLNRSGTVDLVDFGEWKDNFGGNGAAFLSQLVGVPEPSTAGLVLLGALLMGVNRRRNS